MEYEGNKLSKVVERKNKSKTNDIITKFYYNGNVINKTIRSEGNNTEIYEYVYGQENAPHRNWQFEERFYINFLIFPTIDRLTLKGFVPFANNNILEVKYKLNDVYAGSYEGVLKYYYNIYNLNKYPTGGFVSDKNLGQLAEFSFKY